MRANLPRTNPVHFPEIHGGGTREYPQLASPHLSLKRAPNGLTHPRSISDVGSRRTLGYSSQKLTWQQCQIRTSQVRTCYFCTEKTSHTTGSENEMGLGGRCPQHRVDHKKTNIADRLILAAYGFNSMCILFRRFNVCIYKDLVTSRQYMSTTNI